MHDAYHAWGSNSRGQLLPVEVSGGNMGTDEVTEEQTDVDLFASNITGLDATPDVGPQGKGDLEMATLTGASLNATLEHVVMTSTHPTDIDPRNLAVMISLSAFIISTGMVCWAAISDFVDVSDLDLYTSSGINAQGFATQTLAKGVEQRGINIAWGLCWLFIGAILMTIAQLVIRKVIIGRHIDVVEAVLERGNVAAAICEAGMQISMGLIVSATIGGPPGHFGEDIAAVILYFVLSLISLVAWSKIFDLYTTEWSTWKEIERGNQAAAISQFAQMVSTALLMSNAISKTFELATFFTWLVLGTIIRMLFRLVLDYFVIAPRFHKPRYTRQELQIDSLILKGNWGAALVVAALQIILTEIINSFLPGSCAPFVYSDGRSVRQMSLAEKLSGTEFVMLIFKWDRLVAIAIIFVVFVAARIPYDLRLHMRSKGMARDGDPPMDPDLNFYIVENSKHAVTISFGAYQVAVGNMLVGIFADANYNTSFVNTSDPGAWGYLFVQILVGYVMICVALFISDVAILHKFDNLALMTLHDNRAVALVEAGSLIGSSFIVGAVTQLLFFVFQLIFEAITVYDDEKEVELGNAAAGLNNGLNLVAVGMLLARATYLSHSLVMLVCWAVVTYPLIFIFRIVTDKIVLPHISFEATIECLDRLRPDVDAPRRPCRQGNWGTALVAGAVTISVAQLLNTFLRDCPFLFGVPALV
eukprot:CAMPEP_0173112566 /NCGR_PEP_ID=MMETSP1102-20130122/46147_1 /TAXON_ID=49646 /ORGANISM="Geminigera sp., Strain Caron Lab Isolate" /LENGTH=701 /DNA_ID=CAMNT_0014013767 /DNA_START=108 /DNA_END=2213 /DNA_ORIENTATION=-